MTKPPIQPPPSQPIEEHPPPYSSPTTPPSTSPASQHQQPQNPTPGLPNLPFIKYSIPSSTISKDNMEVVTKDTTLNTKPASLTRFLRDRASLPPLPYIRITGSSLTADGYTKKIDFDIKVNMLRYFLPDSQISGDTGGGRWNYVKLGEVGGEVGRNGKPSLLSSSSSSSSSSSKPRSLEEWTMRYCNDNTALKSITLIRQTSNWNTSLLEGQIRTLVAATGYTGQVSVTFPLQYGKITVQPPRGGIDGFLTTVFSPLMEKKRYEVVTAVWPYASMPPGAEDRVCAVQTEEAWWEEWRGVIRVAVVEGRKGWVSVDDLLVFKMRPVGDGGI